MRDPLRLWASTETITFDELAPHVGETVEASFGISLASLAPFRRLHSGWTCDFTDLGESAMVQVSELGRTWTAATGTLTSGAAPSLWRLDSRVPIRLTRPDESTRRTLEELSQESAAPIVQGLGTLSIVGRELRPDGEFVPVRLLRFQSLNLRSDDPRFGTWHDVARYGDLGSDPDVIGAPVLVAEIEVLA